MMNHDDEVPERQRDQLQDWRERPDAQGGLAGHGEHGCTEHLLALKTDAMELTAVTEPTQLGHVVLRARRDAHRARVLRLADAPGARGLGVRLGACGRQDAEGK